MDISGRKCGKNVRKLAFAKFSREVSSLADGIGLIKSLGESEGRQKMRDAFEWVFSSIEEIKSHPDNTFGDDDEAIAGAILAKAEETKLRNTTNRRSK